jgi:quercetin dioxygenase-like cupin family protein
MTTAEITHAYRIVSGQGLADLWWKTGRVAIKASGAETGGRFSQVEIDDPMGTAPPMHIHHAEDETFYVVEGSVTVFAGDEQIRLEAGDFGFVPRGTPHAYLVTSDSARVLVTFSPAGFEDFFVEMGVPADGDTPPADGVTPSPEEFARRLAPYSCEVVGPPPTLADLDR